MMKNGYSMSIIEQDRRHCSGCRHYKIYQNQLLEYCNYPERSAHMEIEVIEQKLDKIFDEAVDVEDTIWYSTCETLRDAILSMIEQEIELNSH